MMRINLRSIAPTLLLAALFTFGGPAAAGPGDLDPTYGVGGFSTLRIGPSLDTLSAVARQSDGKIVSVGYVPQANRQDALAVTRHLANGMLDGDFATGGRYTLAISGRGNQGQALAVQPDGGIVVAAECESVTICLIRLLPDGTRDGAFGAGGTVRVAVGPFNPEPGVRAMALRADGSIVIAVLGTIHQFTPNGAVDASFGSAGKTTIPLANAQISHLLIQPDGKVVSTGARASTDFFAVRLLPGGAADPGFGLVGSGVRSIAVQGSGLGPAGARSAALQADGKLVIVGCAVHPDLG
jgi:uncharacterized delta-60 repeat protein